MSGYVTIRFPEVHAWAERVGKCPVCGKRSVRKRKFTHTVNPFNRRPDGEPKSRAEVQAAVSAEARAWVPDFTHAKCADGAQ